MANATLLDLPNELLQIIGDMSENNALYETNRRFRTLFTDNFFNRYISIDKVKYIRKYCYKIKRLKDIHYKYNLKRFKNLTHLMIKDFIEPPKKKKKDNYYWPSAFAKIIKKQILPEYLPPKLTHLVFEEDSHFNESLDNLPSTITHLTLGKLYNQPLNNLPLTVTHLTIGVRVSAVPQSITHLTIIEPINLGFGLYDHPLSIAFNNLLPSLQYIKFAPGSGFNKSLNKLPSIKYLYFGDGTSFYRSLNNLPHSLEYLHFGNNCRFKNSLNYLPSSLKHLVAFTLIKKRFRKLPCGLKSLTISPRYNNIRFDRIFEEKLWPTNLPYIKVYQEPSILSKQLVAHPLVKKRFNLLPPEPFYIKYIEPPEISSIHNNTMNNDSLLYPVVVGTGIVITGLIVGKMLSKH